MQTIAVQTYSSHERAAHAYEVAESKASAIGLNTAISKAGSVGASYGGLVGATMGVLLSGTVDSMILAALIGLSIGSAVGSLDSAFKSYQTRRKSLAGVGRLN